MANYLKIRFIRFGAVLNIVAMNLCKNHKNVHSDCIVMLWMQNEVSALTNEALAENTETQQ